MINLTLPQLNLKPIFCCFFLEKCTQKSESSGRKVRGEGKRWEQSSWVVKKKEQALLGSQLQAVKYQVLYYVTLITVICESFGVLVASGWAVAKDELWAACHHWRSFLSTATCKGPVWVNFMLWGLLSHGMTVAQRKTHLKSQPYCQLLYDIRVARNQLRSVCSASYAAQRLPDSIIS